MPVRTVVYSRIMADEQETTSKNNAVAEPVVESDEASEQEPEKEPDENTEWEGKYGEAGCPIWMDSYRNFGCGRKLHVAPDGIDEKPVCLMHSKDPGKQSGPLFEVFRQEFREDSGRRWGERGPLRAICLS